ncbi:MAG: LuxR C-terminal-related transcriptional regulator [Treponema sp.]|nr:LuxR C-terminal-related transcriptional regulator [Treponema sp.]
MAETLFHGYTPIAPGKRFCLERPRIFRLLEKAVQNPIVSVVAGAGCGKSSAVYSFVRKYNICTAWIQCSERDNMGERFWENFVPAVSVISKGLARKLAKMNFPATDRQFEQYLGVPGWDLIPNKYYIFVFDDLHLITDKSVLGFLERFIAGSFPNISSVLISRTEPALTMGDFKSKDLVSRITEEELRFNIHEMVSFFKLNDLRPNPRTAAVIYQDTGGWPFAVHLAALALKRCRAGEAYAPLALRANVYKLIESEIMAALSPELQRFLIKLSLMENLKPDLIRELGCESSLIQEMEKISSFICFDNDLRTCHIHQLFMDYLRKRQDELSGEEKNDVLTRAARWYAANNYKMDAILCCEKTGDYNGIVTIFFTFPMLLSRRVAAFILDILDRAPSGLYRDIPQTIVMRNRALISMGFLDQCRRELKEIIPRLRALKDNPEKHHILASCYINQGFIGYLQSAYSRRYDFINHFREAAAESRLSGIVSKAPVNGVTLSAYACRVIAPAGRNEIEQFIRAVADIVPYSAEALGGCQVGLYELVLGEYAFFRAEPGEAEKQLRTSLGRAREMGQYEIENRSLFYLLRIYLGRSDADGINDVLNQLEAEREEPLFPNRQSYYDIVTGWYHIQTGRNDLAAQWLKNDYGESDLSAGAQTLERLVKAKYFISEKHYPAALAVLESRGNGEAFLLGTIEIKVLEAICRWRLSDKEGAFSALGEARRLAVPAGIVMPFIEPGKDMRALAEGALREKAARDAAAGDKASADTAAADLPREWLEEIRRSAALYAKKLYPQIKRAHGGSAREDGWDLSDREIDVLKGLSLGFTRDEIANAASISLNTVKSVIRSIYNKLGALNQADAVRIAVERNIL